MSVANLLGRASATAGSKTTFADGLGDIFVKSLNVAEITAYDPLLAPIVVEGGMDFNLTGGIEGLTAVEADALYSRNQQLIALSGDEVGVLGTLYCAGDADVLGNLTISGDCNLDGGANLSQSLTMNAGSMIDVLPANGLFVEGVRGVAHGLGVGVLHYDTITHEITYSTT